MVLMAVFMISSVALADSLLEITGTYVNVRSGVGTENPVLTQMPRGDTALYWMRGRLVSDKDE
jgi:uncharacterized protein YraI